MRCDLRGKCASELFSSGESTAHDDRNSEQNRNRQSLYKSKQTIFLKMRANGFAQSSKISMSARVKHLAKALILKCTECVIGRALPAHLHRFCSVLLIAAVASDGDQKQIMQACSAAADILLGGGAGEKNKKEIT